ncbi:MAG: hypothetical protein ACM4AI_05425 [Acidobacteriota bacterium]
MSVVLFWILRVLFVLFIIRLVLRALGIGQPPRAPQQRTRRMEHAGGTLVQDPHCGTYLPQSRALALGRGDETKYFCSPACRDAHLAGTVAEGQRPKPQGQWPKAQEDREGSAPSSKPPASTLK